MLKTVEYEYNRDHIKKKRSYHSYLMGGVENL